MSFFSKYNGSTNVRLVRIERLTWVLIYGGLLAAVLGTFMGDAAEQSGVALQAVGGVAVAVGIAMIFVRSRLGE